MSTDPRTVPQDELRSAIAEERIALADDLSTLTGDEWGAPSLCAGWSVHEVVAHVSQSGFPHTWAWIASAVRHGGPDGGEDVRTRARAARHGPAELVELLRESATSTYRLPLSNRWDPYVDLLVHGQDALRPLGRTHPVPRRLLAPALTFAWSSPLYGVRRRLRTVRFAATDLDWTAGDGPLELHGPAADLLLAVTGRAVGLAGLSGTGRETAESTLGG
ncbi:MULTISPECIES: maleylpyruvate isomerase family mycothiol-dependent enzyme [unclassified Pseudonocardia]|uniref:maleylpyruvate isomerase family mycothiol-dependent enzyme n=1 Tax=unclassified Pseudonocardia TaxID=2619320 RepID=UPI0001FFF1F1|nr:maleylpyruvate isomerase family mycothiol-dependent enzyme [Pseudonocardia sp. Ae707_Ps1]OLM21098.1 hypothetical protein Ae707Ps1_5357 [Pseudonocardia sp. Ae707_Ps1]